MMRTHDQINAAFMPLTDCAPLIVAHEIGFAEEEGVALNLLRETSWATVRDRLAVSHIDIAHALAPMPLASNLRLNPLQQSIIAPIALGFGGNTVTVSTGLWTDLQQNYNCPANFDAGLTLASLCKLTAKRKATHPQKLRFGIVHPHSAHRYELAYWLASGGIMPERDVEFIVLPPSLMSTALGKGSIDGFCAGEPWGSIASRQGVGRILTSKPHIWRSSPEKVLAVREIWAEQNARTLHSLLRAIYRSCCWCDEPENRQALAELLARESYLNQPSEVILPGLNRTLVAGSGQLTAIDGLLNFCGRAATFPWVSHALWLYTQMVRWGEISFTSYNEQVARSTYRPDIYRLALGALDNAIPSADAKVEGALEEETAVGAMTHYLMIGPDGFFDGRMFDPDFTRQYIVDLISQDQKSLAPET